MHEKNCMMRKLENGLVSILNPAKNSFKSMKTSETLREIIRIRLQDKQIPSLFTKEG